MPKMMLTAIMHAAVNGVLGRNTVEPTSDPIATVTSL